ncbi:MAG: HAD-IIB family hydrolase [Treponema sp.]|jgi:Cof subfamily protein (haloacid dehalogenase superfamily)|nr:HAD-IIB family hydrolase [Treponema sp.]
MKKAPQAIFLDIDGTLILNDEGPFDEDIEQIKIAKGCGHLFFLNTGRAFSNISAVLKEATYIDGMIMGSGTHVRLKGETIYHKWISEKILTSVCRYYLSNKKWCVFEGETDLYGINKFDPALFVGEVTPISDENDFPRKYHGVKITKLTIEGEPTAEERNFLEDHFQLNSFSSYYEGIIKGEDKSNGIKAILKETGILLENSIAIGDSINDISALHTVHFGIAMGNACDELKEIAQYITDDCKHGGVGKAIKIMVLG